MPVASFTSMEKVKRSNKKKPYLEKGKTKKKLFHIAISIFKVIPSFLKKHEYAVINARLNIVMHDF